MVMLVWAALIVPALAVFVWLGWLWVRTVRRAGRAFSRREAAVATAQGGVADEPLTEAGLLGEIRAAVAAFDAAPEGWPRRLAGEVAPLCWPGFPGLLEAAQAMFARREGPGWDIARMDLDYMVVETFAPLGGLDRLNFAGMLVRLTDGLRSADGQVSRIAALNALNYLDRGYFTDASSVAGLQRALEAAEAVHRPVPAEHGALREALDRHL